MGKSKVRIVGAKELQSNLRNLGSQCLAAALRGLARACVDILNDAKQRLTDGGQRATNLLFNSGKVQRSQEADNAYEILFDTEYAEFVEFGRRPGKQPPVDQIKAWIDKRHILDTYSIKTHKQTKRGSDYEKRRDGLAFAIARSIGKKGTKAHPFLHPALEANKEKILPYIKDEIKKLTR